MPRGFAGQAAVLYLTQVSDAHTRAVDTSRNTPEGTRAPRERRLPFEPGDGKTGSFSIGRGDSSNIVVNESDYIDIASKINKADERMGYCLYDATREIEEMCMTSFVLPKAVPRCINITDEVKRSLEQYRYLTEEATMGVRRFAREITDIGY